MALTALLFHLALAAQGTPPAAAPPLTYHVTVLPDGRHLMVNGSLRDPREVDAWRAKEEAWVVADAGVGDPTVFASSNGEVNFSYVVSVPKREVSNSTEIELDENRMRTWGFSAFIHPQLVNEASVPIQVCFELPVGWSVAAPNMTGNCTTVSDVSTLIRTPFLAGKLETRSFTAAGARVEVAFRGKTSVGPEEYQRKLTRLVVATSAYLGAPPKPLVFFGIDQLGDKKSNYPANNYTTDDRTMTILVESAKGTKDLRFWGTYAHEYLHSWDPNAFGDFAKTRDELGSIFSEGFADYLAYTISRQAGFYSDAEYLKALSLFYLEFANKRDDPKTNPEILRYRQGMLAAWLIDLELLRVTHGRQGFRELMRLLQKKHANTDGLTKAELTGAIREIGGAAVADMYGPITDITGKFDFVKVFARHGIVVTPVANLSAAIDEELTVVKLVPQSRAQKRVIAKWLKKPDLC